MVLPRVSIIIVNWNGLEDTIECLESFKKISYPNYEVIVVDNGSEGDDARILREKFGDYIRLIQNDKNYGFAKGCNVGVEDALARGAEYILLVNNDTVIAPDSIDELIKVAQSDKNIGIVGGKIYFYEDPQVIWFAGGSINFWAGRTPLRGQGQIDCQDFDKVVAVDWIVGCFMLISRDVLLNVGLLDERFFFGWEDVDICIRAARNGFRILFAPEAKLWHKALASGKGERLVGIPLYYAARNHFILMEKHWPKLQFITSVLYYLLTFPKTATNYSRLLHQRSASKYMLWGIWDYLRRRW
jgi:hypothetical protein